MLEDLKVPPAYLEQIRHPCEVSINVSIILKSGGEKNPKGDKMSFFFDMAVFTMGLRSWKIR